MKLRYLIYALMVTITGLLAICPNANAQAPSGYNALTDFPNQPFTTTGGVVPRTSLQRAMDSRQAIDYAVCDGTTDDSSALTTAQSGNYRISVKDGQVCNAPPWHGTDLPPYFKGLDA